MNTNAYTHTYAPNTYVPFQAAPRKAARVKVPGRGGAIARLIVMFLFVIGGFVSSFISLFTYDGTVGQLILEAIASSAMLSLLGAWFWVIMKWFGFIVPKAFNLAKSFWQAWTSFSLIGLYFKCVGFIVILMLPISAGFSTYMPLFSLAMAFAGEELTFLPTMGLSLLSFLVVAALTLVDVCKLRGTTVLDTVKQFLSARKR